MSANKQKHLLILSAPMGSGHIRAAKALDEWVKLKYPQLKITNINVEEYISSFFKFIYIGLYIIFNNNFSFLWSLVYYNTDTSPGDSWMEIFLNWVRRRSSRKIVKMILNQHGNPEQIADDWATVFIRILEKKTLGTGEKIKATSSLGVINY